MTKCIILGPSLQDDFTDGISLQLPKWFLDMELFLLGVQRAIWVLLKKEGKGKDMTLDFRRKRIPQWQSLALANPHKQNCKYYRDD